MRLVVSTAIALAAFSLAASPSRAASGFDGQYEGTATLDQHRGRTTCKPDYPVHIHVADNSFKFHWIASDVVENVGTDGAFSQSEGQITVDGKIAGPSLEGYIVGVNCTYRIKATKS